jgi:hypothetical protein
MKMPGFTAEASLYAPWRHYSSVVQAHEGFRIILPSRCSVRGWDRPAEELISFAVPG